MANSPSVIEYVLGRLRDTGVTEIFGVPGDYAFPINDAIVADSVIEWVGCCNELNAAYAADGYARVRGVGAVSTTYGVGELSAIGAIAGSYAENVPVFHLVGMPNRATQGQRALVHHTLGNGEFDLFKHMADTVVGASAILTPENAAHETERLISEALVNRRPVYMAIPSDVVDQPILATSRPRVLPESNEESLAAAVEDIATRLERAQSVAVLPGVIVDRLGLADTLTTLVEAATLPFATAFNDKSVLDETHPNYIGMYDGELMDETVREYVESADCVLVVGSLQSDFNTGKFTANISPDRKVTIGPDSVATSEKQYCDVRIGDVLTKLSTYGFEARELPTLPRLSRAAAVDDADGAITADSLYPRWANFLRENDILVTETGTSSMGLAFAPMPKGAKFFNQTLWGAIGWATPASLGAAVAAKDRRIVLVTGEGSHQLTVQEISQFGRLGLKPVIFVLNNDGYLIERLLCEDPEIEYNDVARWKYSQLPDAFGCDGWFTARVQTNGELDRALNSASNADNACYIEIVTAKYEAPALANKMKT